jgi:predicted amidophosphoribosyltransferase
LAKGVAEVLQKPLWNDLIKRNRSTATQTKKTRSERWENIEGIFTISSRREIKDLHLLVVDDVITTGATLEACAASLREQGAKISISTLAYAMK